MVEKQTVQMEFDNKNFEKNVSTSISTLDKLKVGLASLASGANGIAGMAMQIKGITFDPINNGVQMGIGKVMALTAALTGVVNITDTLYQKVTSTVKALSVDQITAGFSKYESKTASVQTIMNAVRKEGEADEEVMARVEEQLEKLNWFTDETSYNFTDMVSNIGKFTSQGIDLDKSVTAMQGIATWAAKSGQGTAEASRAMYNLSQAMGVGAVKLMDWKSIENANMATKEFKQQAMEAAVAVGTLRKEGEKYIDVAKNEEVSVQNFSQSLASGWFTSDALLDVLNNYGKYADMVHEMQDDNETAAETMARMKELGMEAGNELAASAFKAAQEAKTFTEAIDATKDAVSTAFLNIFETLFGNYLEAKGLWTDFANLLYDAFAEPVVAIADLVKEWKELGGRTKLLESVTRVIESFSAIFEKFSETFTDVFGSVEDKLPALNNLTQSIDLLSIRFSNFINTLIENENIWNNLTKLFKGTKRAIDFVKISFKEIIDKIFKPLTEKWLPIGIDKFSDLIGLIGDFITDISNKAIAFDPVGKGIDLVITGITALIDKIKEFLGITSDVEKKAITLKEKLHLLNIGIFDPDKYEVMISPIQKFKNAFTNVIEFFMGAALKVSPLFGSIWNTVKSFFNWIITLAKDIGPALQKAGVFIKNALDKIGSFMDAFVETTKTSDKNAFELMAELIAGGIMYLMDKLKGVDLDRLNGWLDAIEKIIRMVAEIVAIYMLLTDGSISIGNVELPFAGIFDSLSESLEKMGKAKKTEATAKLVEALALALVAIAGALLMISFIPADRLEDSTLALAAITVVFTIMVGAMETLFTKMSTMMNNKSLLSSVGIDSISVTIAAMSAFVLSLGGAILLLTSALAIIGTMDWKDALEGLTGIVSLMVSLIATAYSLKGIEGATKLIGVGIAMIVIANAVNVIALAVAKLGNSENIIDGIVGVTDTLITMIGVMYALSGLKNLKSILLASVALILVANATNKIVKAIVKLSKIKDVDSLTTAGLMITAIMGYLLLLVSLSSTLSNSSGIIAVAASMVVISIAISNLAKVIEDINKIGNPEGVTKTLVQLGGLATGLIAFTGILILLSKTLTTGGKLDMSKVAALVVTASVLVAMILPLNAITDSIVKLSNINETKLLAGAGAISVIFTAMTGVLMSSLLISGDKILGMLATALAIDMLAAALLAITPVLEGLSKVDPNIMLVIGVLAAITGLFIQALNIMGGTTTLIQIAGVIDLLSLSLVMVGAALLLAAQGLGVFLDNLIKLAEVGPETWQNLFDNFSQAVINWWTALGPLIIRAFDDVFIGVCTSILENADLFTNALATLLGTVVRTLLNILMQYLPNIIAALDLLITLLTPFIEEKLLPFIGLLTADITEYAINLLNIYIPKLNAHLEKVTWDLFIRILRLLNKGVPLLNEELAKEGLNLIIWINWLLQQATAVIIRGTIGILKQLRDNIDEIIALTVEIGTMAIFGLIEGIIATIPLLYEKGVQAVDELLDLINTVLDANWDEITKTLETLANKTIDVANKWVEKESEVGGKIFTIVGNLFKGLAKAAFKQAATSVYSPWGLGQWIGDKITTGICKTMKINSPSKVMEKIGGYIMQGLSIGVQKGSEVLSPVISDIKDIFVNDFTKSFGSISDIGNGLLESFQSNFTSLDFGSILGDFTNLNPTITPQLDLSEIENGVMGLDSMFASQQMSGFVDFSKYSGSDSVTQADTMNKMMDKLQNYMDVESYNKETADTNVNVTLDANAKKMLKVVKVENNKQSKATRVNQLANA